MRAGLCRKYCIEQEKQWDFLKELTAKIPEISAEVDECPDPLPGGRRGRCVWQCCCNNVASVLQQCGTCLRKRQGSPAARGPGRVPAGKRKQKSKASVCEEKVEEDSASESGTPEPAHPSTAHPSTVQPSTAQPSTVQPSTRLLATTHSNLVTASKSRCVMAGVV